MKAPGRQAGGRQLALQRLVKSRGAAEPHAGRGSFGRALAQALGGQAAFALAGDNVQRFPADRALRTKILLHSRGVAGSG